MRKSSEELNCEQAVSNISYLCGEKIEELPYWETINHYLKKLDLTELQGIMQKLAAHLIRSRIFEDHPEEFLKGFRGVCVTDSYQAYHSLKEKTDSLVIVGRKYADALKVIKDKEKRKGTLAYDALKQIGKIYKLDNELAGLETR